MEFNPNNLMNSIWSLVPTGFPDFDWDIPDFWNAFLCCHMRLLAQLYPKNKQGGRRSADERPPPRPPSHTHVAKRCWVQAGRRRATGKAEELVGLRGEGRGKLSEFQNLKI